MCILRRVVPKAGTVRPRNGMTRSSQMTSGGVSDTRVEAGHKWCAALLCALASSWLCWWGESARLAGAMVEVVAEHSLCGCRMARLSSWLAAGVALTGVTMAEVRTWHVGGRMAVVVTKILVAVVAGGYMGTAGSPCGASMVGGARSPTVVPVVERHVWASWLEGALVVEVLPGSRPVARQVVVVAIVVVQVVVQVVLVAAVGCHVVGWLSCVATARSGGGRGTGDGTGCTVVAMVASSSPMQRRENSRVSSRKTLFWQ